MDVVGGVIVAAQSKTTESSEDRARMTTTGVKRGHYYNYCSGGDYHCNDAATAGAMRAWGEAEPWNLHRRMKAARESGEDYELRSVSSCATGSCSSSSTSIGGRLVRSATISTVTSFDGDAPGTRALLPFNRPANSLLRTHSWIEPLSFQMKKELTVTDVGELGRIILPKRDAECQLPHLDSKEGKLLHMEDYNSNKHWTLRYKWWPNNKSRMYVLENTGEFVKYYDLKEKDELIVYKDGIGNLVIRGQKWSSSPMRTDSFLGPRGKTTTGKRSVTGKRSLKVGSPTNPSSNSSPMLTMSVLSSSVLTTGSVLNGEHPGGEIAPIGAYGGGAAVQSEGAIDWEKLPDPPAIEFSDPPALEFPGEFECTWGDCI